MAVVDSSALIPLAWVGRLDLLEAAFDDIRTTEAVRAEVIVEGKRGTAALDEFLDNVHVHDTADKAEAVASMEGIAMADASVILLAESTEEHLLANDKALIEVARTHGVECWWVTTLLLRCTNAGTLTAAESTDILYDLMDEGLNLHPKVYAQVEKKLRELGD